MICAIPRTRAAARVGRQQRRARLCLLQVFENRHRLEERRVVVDDKGRHDGLRVHCLVTVGVLLAFEEIDRSLLERNALQLERDPHAAGRERAPESVELEHGLLRYRGGIMGSST
jgi:hypothetical protein